MAFCANCGAQAQGGAFCANCGASVAASAQPTASSNNSQGATPSYTGGTNYAMWTHLGALLVSLFSGGLLAWLPALLIRQSKGSDPYVNQQALASINFQLQWLILNIGFAIIGVLTCGIGFFLSGAAAIFELIVMIMATVATASYQNYKYPLQFMTFVR